MLMSDMHPGDIARITLCNVRGVPGGSYKGCLVLRTHSGVFVVIDGKEHLTGRNMRGDTFAWNATGCYEVVLVTVEMIPRPIGDDLPDDYEVN